MIKADGEPWFVAKDVCSELDIANVTQAVGQLDDDERSMFNIGRQGDTNIINEPGLYSPILRSRKPEAKAFKRWITHEVLPASCLTMLREIFPTARTLPYMRGGVY